MEIKNKTSNVSKKHLINARTSDSFAKWQDNENIIAAALAEDIDSDGHVEEYSYIWTDTHVYAGNAAAIKDVLPDLIEMIEDGEALVGRCIIRQSKSGKDFVTLVIEE